MGQKRRCTHSFEFSVLGLLENCSLASGRSRVFDEMNTVNSFAVGMCTLMSFALSLRGLRVYADASDTDSDN